MSSHELKTAVKVTLQPIISVIYQKFGDVYYTVVVICFIN